MLGTNCVLDLPNEILASILNEVASDDEDETLEALASCRLASHVFCSLATPLFFSSIRLTDTIDDGVGVDYSIFVKRATRLKKILTIQNIADSVHTLTLRCHHQTLENSTNGTLISDILCHLLHIRSFALQSRDCCSNFFLFSEDFVSAIRALCRSITTLSLDSIRGFPFTVITGCPNLRCLRLWYVRALGFDNVNSKDEISSPQLLYLDSLEIDWNSLYTLGSRIKDMSIARHFTRIKNLQVRYLFYDARTLKYGWDIMLLASQTLTKLDLIVDLEDHLEEALGAVPFDLDRFPALRHLKIKWRSSYENDPARFCFLTRLLSMSSSNDIEVLEIQITWYGIQDEYGKTLFSLNAGWSTLDQLLTSQTFGSLRKVVLRLGIECSPWVWQWKDDDPRRKQNLELEKNWTLPYINDLFPLFRALKRKVESHLKFT